MYRGCYSRDTHHLFGAGDDVLRHDLAKCRHRDGQYPDQPGYRADHDGLLLLLCLFHPGTMESIHYLWMDVRMGVLVLHVHFLFPVYPERAMEGEGDIGSLVSLQISC